MRKFALKSELIFYSNSGEDLKLKTVSPILISALAHQRLGCQLQKRTEVSFLVSLFRLWMFLLLSPFSYFSICALLASLAISRQKSNKLRTILQRNICYNHSNFSMECLKQRWQSKSVRKESLSKTLIA